MKVLQVMLGGKNFTGVASFLCNYYKYMDHSKVMFDFLFCKENSFGTIQNQDLFTDSKIYTLNILKDNNTLLEHYKLQKKVYKILKKSKYDYVHVNTGNLFIQYDIAIAAKKCNTKCIAHSHNQKFSFNNGFLKTFVRNMVSPICQRYIKKNNCYIFACSPLAATTVFGDNVIQYNNFRIINNAIELDKYKYNPQIRESVRIKYGVSNEKIYGFVGRIEQAKNPFFLLEIFKCILKREPNAFFWIIGKGSMLDDVNKWIIKNNLNEKIKCFGEVHNVNEIMQALDALVMPSLLEGLPIVLVEAQAADLPIYVSEAIPNEANITGNIVYKSLNLSASEWAIDIIHDMKTRNSRDNEKFQKIKEAGYDILTETKKLERLYLES